MSSRVFTTLPRVQMNYYGPLIIKNFKLIFVFDFFKFIFSSISEF